MILAVDLGSTSFKAGVFDQRLALRGFAACPVRHRYAPGGRVELEIEEAASVFQSAVREAIQKSNLIPEAIRAMAVTSQAQTFTVVDKSGRPKMPFISWQDTRAQHSCEMLRKDATLADFGSHASFGRLLAALEICQLKHLQEERPGFIAPEDRVLNLPTFLVHRCTGMAVVDNNLAAMSGLYSIELHDWWPAALEACGLRTEQLPGLTSIGSIASHTSRDAVRMGLAEGIPVVLAGNDQTAGAYGAQLDETGGVLITLGTAQVAYACVKEAPAPDPMVVRGPYPGGLHYRMAADSCGGNLIKWAQTVLAGCETDAAFFARADAAEVGCHGLVFDAELPEGGGAWRNVALHHTAAEFARSVVESLAKRMAAMVERLNVDPSATRFLAAGGGSGSAVWVRILSDVLGAPIAVTQSDPLYGAARMALQSGLESKDRSTPNQET